MKYDLNFVVDKLHNIYMLYICKPLVNVQLQLCSLLRSLSQIYISSFLKYIFLLTKVLVLHEKKGCERLQNHFYIRTKSISV